MQGTVAFIAKRLSLPYPLHLIISKRYLFVSTRHHHERNVPPLWNCQRYHSAEMQSLQTGQILWRGMSKGRLETAQVAMCSGGGGPRVTGATTQCYCTKADRFGIHLSSRWDDAVLFILHVLFASFHVVHLSGLGPRRGHVLCPSQARRQCPF